MSDTEQPATEPGPGKTRWGDRVGRRRDILAAARAQMAERGYLGLNMRDIAAGAGVSPGTLYSYFATKEEIFATLYAEAIVAHNEGLVPICAAAGDLEELLVDVITAHLDLHGTYGRYFSLWAGLAVDGAGGGHNGGEPARLPVELTAALREATLEQGEIVTAALRRLVPGPRRPGEQRRRIALVWSVMNGIAEQLHTERHQISRVDGDELIRFAAHTLAAGLLANAADDEPAPAPDLS